MKITKDKLEWIASKSFRDCHAEGVDSLLFDDTPGARVRAFICRPSHTLWRNQLTDRRLPLSVGLHPHHCRIALELIFGLAWNVTEVVHGGWRNKLAEFKYESAITGQQGRFVATNHKRMFRLLASEMKFGQRVEMGANQLHTIFVPRYEQAAWWVYEFEDDPTYKACAYSDDNLEKLDFSQLYRPMSLKQTIAAIRKMGIEVET